ncbi:MAG: DUF456 domain-containing protein [Planctomycetota bacterium]
MSVVAGVIVVLFAVVGAVLTFLTLPGIWIAVFVALLVELWRPELLGWWSLGIAIGLAVLAEIAEFLASAAGAGRAGGSRAGMAGSIIGSIVGLIAGSVVLAFLPIIGSIIGAVVGAGAGAMIAERGVAQRTWKESLTSGQGAATGRAVSILIKGGFAIAVALVLTAGVLIP